MTCHTKYNHYCDRIISIVLFSFFCLSIISCGKKLRKEKISVTIVSYTDFESSKKDTILYIIKTFINYHVSLEHKDTVLFPSLTVSRFDINETKSVEIPLTGSNRTRKSLGLLTTKQLMKNYDKKIPDLILPEFFDTKAGKNVPIENVLSKYPNALQIDINLLRDEISAIKNRIYDSLFSKRSEAPIIIILNNGNKPKEFPKAGTYLNRDTCDYLNHILYQAVTDGNGGVKFGDKMRDNSPECDTNKTSVKKVATGTGNGKNHVPPQQPNKVKGLEDETNPAEKGNLPKNQKGN